VGGEGVATRADTGDTQQPVLIVLSKGVYPHGYRNLSPTPHP
jgi:hypothetical protein